MFGYPTFVSPNIVVKALFNPNVKYQGLIQVQSELTSACGIWKIIKLDLVSLSEIRSEHTDGEVRRELASAKCVRQPARFSESARPCSEIGGCARRCNT